MEGHMECFGASFGSSERSFRKLYTYTDIFLYALYKRSVTH